MNEPVIKDSITKQFCSSCGGERNCDILGSYHEVSSCDSVEFYTDWRILKCRGCDSVFCLTINYNSEDVDYCSGPTGEGIASFNTSIKYWPAPAKRKKPDWYDELRAIDIVQEKLINPLDELYGALDADLPILSGIAVRSCFEIVAELLSVDPNLPFNEKLKKLVTDGKLGASAESKLSILIDAGHAATHRGWIPEPDDLKTLVDILEAFMRDKLVEPARSKKLDDRAAKLKDKVPPDPRKRQKRKPATELT